MVTIEWRVPDDKPLPSDSKHFSVKARNGPNDYEVTSWLQLMDVTRDFSGVYSCVASNSRGEAKASATLTIGNFKKTFPLEF